MSAADLTLRPDLAKLSPLAAELATPATPSASHGLASFPASSCSDDTESLDSYQALDEFSPRDQQPAGLAALPSVDSSSPPAVPSAEALAASPHFPVLVAAGHAPGVSLGSVADSGSLPVNDGRPIAFESDLFQGQACVFIQGLPCAPPAALFGGKRRKSLLVVQGQFKRCVGFDDLVTGQEFERAKNLPPSWLLDNVLLKVARSMSPSMEVGPSRAPYMLMPVVAGCNEIHVAATPDTAPPLTSPPREDMRLVDPDALSAGAGGAPLPCDKRRAWFSDPKRRRGRCFEPGLVWTFYFYQHLVDVSSYTLNMVYRFKLPNYLDGQPLQLMLKDRREGRYLLRLNMWHEALLADAERQQAQQQAEEL